MQIDFIITSEIKLKYYKKNAYNLENIYFF